MLYLKGRKTFKCKDCGHTFEAFDTEGGIRFGPNLPPCPKCGSRETRKVNNIEHIFNKHTMNSHGIFNNI